MFIRRKYIKQKKNLVEFDSDDDDDDDEAFNADNYLYYHIAIMCN